MSSVSLDISGLEELSALEAGTVLQGYELFCGVGGADCSRMYKLPLPANWIAALPSSDCVAFTFKVLSQLPWRNLSALIANACIITCWTSSVIIQRKGSSLIYPAFLISSFCIPLGIYRGTSFFRYCCSPATQSSKWSNLLFLAELPHAGNKLDIALELAMKGFRSQGS